MADFRMPGFQWDEKKNQENKKNHDGIDFRHVVIAFERKMFDVPDARIKHGEEDRINSIGVIGTTKLVHVHVTHTERDGDIRLISARKAKAHEVAAYHQHLLELNFEQQRQQQHANRPPAVDPKYRREQLTEPQRELKHDPSPQPQPSRSSPTVPIKRESVADEALREYNNRPESVREAERARAAAARLREEEERKKDPGRERSPWDDDPRWG